MNHQQYMPLEPVNQLDRAGSMHREFQSSFNAGQMKAGTYHDDHMKKIAARACAACHRLKMKCVRSPNLPCARCQKAGRSCEFPLPGQSRSIPTKQSSRVFRQLPPPQHPQPTYLRYGHKNDSGGIISGIAHDINTNTEIYSDRSQRASACNPPSHPTAQSIWTPTSPELSTPGSTKDSSDLPSIYSTSPFYTIVEENYIASSEEPNPESFDGPPQSKCRRTGYSDSNDRELYVPRRLDLLQDPLTDQDKTDLINYFLDRIIGYIPILHREDFDDILRLKERQMPLVYCICYVTVRYLPTGKTVRARLLPFIASVLETKFEISKAAEEENLTTLQALIILYSYTQASPGTSNTASHPDLRAWRLKAITETYALQLHIHRSVEAIKNAKSLQVPNITSSLSYKKYTYWLWLYTMSHHSSIVTRTPPSIRADATIRVGPELLREIGMSPQVSRLAGEVELCLHWEKASILETGLGEWWCLPEPIESREDSTAAQLYEIGNDLNSFSKKWNDLLISTSYEGAGLNFHLRFTRFCISSYSIRNLKRLGNSLSEYRKRCIITSVEAAVSNVTWALDLGLVSKDRLRYMCDFGFVILSFCCVFIMQTCQAFRTEIPGIVVYLDTVRETAELLVALAVDYQHAPGQVGRSMLARLNGEQVVTHEPNCDQEVIGSQGVSDTPVVSRTPRWTDLDHLDYDLNSSLTDPIWDLSEMFPDIFVN